MSWLRIDDSFEDHPKVEPLSDAAHRLWMRAACWCKKPTNSHTGGFVPRAMLRTIAKNSASQKKLERLAKELVDARAGGTKEHGLWEPVDGGWRFHDWDNYQPTSDDSRVRNARAEAGRKGAFARWQKQGLPSGLPSPEPLAKPIANSTDSQWQTIAKDAPDPDPGSDLPKTTTTRPESSTRAVDPGGGRVRCPADLRLTDAQRGTLEMHVPGWAIDELTTRFVANHQADSDDTRPIVAWRKCLSQAVAGWWNNTKTRPKQPDKQEPDDPTSQKSLEGWS